MVSEASYQCGYPQGQKRRIAVGFTVALVRLCPKRACQNETESNRNVTEHSH